MVMNTHSIVFTNNDTGEIEFTDESLAKTFLRHLIISGELSLFRG